MNRPRTLLNRHSPRNLARLPMILLLGTLLGACGGGSDSAAPATTPGTFSPLIIESITKNGNGSFCTADLKLTNTSTNTIRFTYDYDALGANNRVVAKAVFNNTIPASSTQTFSQSLVFSNASNIPVNSRCQAITSFTKVDSTAVVAIRRQTITAITGDAAGDPRLTGVWSSAERGLSIAADGRIFGQDVHGCTLTGQIGGQPLLPDIYPVDLIRHFCDPATSQFSGAALIVDEPSQLMIWAQTAAGERLAFGVRR